MTRKGATGRDGCSGPTGAEVPGFDLSGGFMSML
jgi:hypothetical protein